MINKYAINMQSLHFDNKCINLFLHFASFSGHLHGMVTYSENTTIKDFSFCFDFILIHDAIDFCLVKNLSHLISKQKKYFHIQILKIIYQVCSFPIV